ncbi:hypothetical protein KEJ26_01375 [Candidatus Bathyarchaeota archaeon]|nr:hypothetical protein [Candidatus Bathyarchaeota archaeon]
MRGNKVVLRTLFFFAVLVLVVTPVYAQAYIRSWTVTVEKRESFLIWSWTNVENKTITLTVDKATYNYYHDMRLGSKYAQERFYSYKDFIPYYKWLVTVGVEAKPVKDLVAQLKALGLNETNYVNAISQMMAQMTYAHGPAKFAVETMVDWKADCDGFSVFAATILKASGYEVCLIIYRGHVEVGVHLETKPYQRSPDYPIRWLDYKGMRYYPLECAGQNANWGYVYWCVGELPSSLETEFLSKVYIARL